MGVKLLPQSTILPGEVQNGKLLVHVANDYVLEYETGIKEDIPKQCLQFSGHNTVFFLIAESGIRYVGREDGSITGYKSDNTIVKQCKWKYFMGTRHIGSLNYRGVAYILYLLQDGKHILLPNNFGVITLSKIWTNRSPFLSFTLEDDGSITSRGGGDYYAATYEPVSERTEVYYLG